MDENKEFDGLVENIDDEQTTEQFDIINTDENGVVSLKDVIPTIYFQLKADVDKAEGRLKEFKKQLLDAMITHSFPNAKFDSMTCSQVVPKNTILFDTEKFMLNESEDVVAAFTSISTTETFDIEKFKLENPDLYKKYTNVQETANVDVKSLQKKLPSIYQKYVTELVSEKPITLMIREAKK